MDLYLDLSFFSYLIIIFFTYCYLRIFFPKKRRWWLFFIINWCSLLTLLFDINYLPLILLALSLLITFRRKSLLPLITGIGIYLVFIFSLSGFDDRIEIYYFMPAITAPQASLTLLILPISYIVVIIISSVAHRVFKMAKFHTPCRLFAGDKTVVIKGYLDSGNRLLVGGLPVVFLSNNVDWLMNKTKISFRSASGNGESYGQIGEIELRGQRRKVILAIGHQATYHGCQALLNAYLF